MGRRGFLWNEAGDDTLNQCPYIRDAKKRTTTTTTTTTPRGGDVLGSRSVYEPGILLICPLPARHLRIRNDAPLDPKIAPPPPTAPLAEVSDRSIPPPFSQSHTHEVNIQTLPSIHRVLLHRPRSSSSFTRERLSIYLAVTVLCLTVSARL